MLGERLLEELNEQVKFEYESAHYYLALAAYFKAEDLEGFAHFFEVQAEEERFHGQKFFNFIDEMGERVVLKGLGDPENDFDSIVDAISFALDHEKFITKRIYKLMDIAREESNYPAISLLQWFVDEQVEEEASMDALLKKVERIGENGTGIYMLDNELAQRTFTPPAGE
ncbi:ferritin [Halonatronum saccharophilum]|uniref:ferritin n=1 Tax=Halonatronum saccharophilum TaxID=150060 RepID=UPI000488F978|nr:ferritin [Halonatronum saccharophilum]